ncbi:hypothetical protein [Fischerella thermalis]|uniref:hypothetical protein n=2 Tax=Fischerella thermalis TaxID=372787 RepID=UPI001A056EA2|nr:hypothetical protein [Fischerella thermalis]MBF1987982.1 hypothetical protein [Fischerella thermalis M58_A2018_009]MBF2070861.1 hypothetical protein [Fischerella thermalis M48_A2018_028]
MEKFFQTRLRKLSRLVDADWRSPSKKPIYNQRLEVVYEHDNIRYKCESDRKLTDIISINFFVWLYVTTVEDYL